jgi:hypothetical protein
MPVPSDAGLRGGACLHWRVKPVRSRRRRRPRVRTLRPRRTPRCAELAEREPPKMRRGRAEGPPGASVLHLCATARAAAAASSTAALDPSTRRERRCTAAATATGRCTPPRYTPCLAAVQALALVACEQCAHMDALLPRAMCCVLCAVCCVGAVPPLPSPARCGAGTRSANSCSAWCCATRHGRERETAGRDAIGSTAVMGRGVSLLRSGACAHRCCAGGAAFVRP